MNWWAGAASAKGTSATRTAIIRGETFWYVEERKGERRPNKKRLLRLVGLNGPPGEIQRFMGLGGGIDR
jgi:hypothetical protein